MIHQGKYEPLEGPARIGGKGQCYQAVGARYATRWEIVCWHIRSLWDRAVAWFRG